MLFYISYIPVSSTVPLHLDFIFKCWYAKANLSYKAILLFDCAPNIIETLCWNLESFKGSIVGMRSYNQGEEKGKEEDKVM